MTARHLLYHIQPRVNKMKRDGFH